MPVTKKLKKSLLLEPNEDSPINKGADTGMAKVRVVLGRYKAPDGSIEMTIYAEHLHPGVPQVRFHYQFSPKQFSRDVEPGAIVLSPAAKNKAVKIACQGICDEFGYRYGHFVTKDGTEDLGDRFSNSYWEWNRVNQVNHFEIPSNPYTIKQNWPHAKQHGISIEPGHSADWQNMKNTQANNILMGNNVFYGAAIQMPQTMANTPTPPDQVYVDIVPPIQHIAVESSWLDSEPISTDEYLDMVEEVPT